MKLKNISKIFIAIQLIFINITLAASDNSIDNPIIIFIQDDHNVRSLAIAECPVLDNCYTLIRVIRTNAENYAVNHHINMDNYIKMASIFMNKSINDICRYINNHKQNTTVLDLNDNLYKKFTNPCLVTIDKLTMQDKEAIRDIISFHKINFYHAIELLY